VTLVHLINKLNDSMGQVHLENTSVES
jgi:hypothetical protein